MESDVAAMVGWLRLASNPQRRRAVASVAAGSVNVKTGKRRLPEGYSSSKINQTLAAVHGFYGFHARFGAGPLVNPVPVSRDRRRVLAHHNPLQRFAALSTGAFVIAFAIFAGMLAIRPSAKLTDVTIAEFAAQCLNLALLAIVFGALAIGIGAATGRRALVFTITAVIGVIAYALHSFAGQLRIEGGRLLSPFHYYIGGEPLKNSWQWTDATVLLVAALVLVATGIIWFNRRDLNT